MYKDFYQFKESPFNITADPDFFYASLRHTEAFSHLIYGIKERQGIIVLTGEIGTGKTTLIKTLLNRLDHNTTKTALILNPNFSSLQLLQLILKDFGIHGTFTNKFAIVNALNEFLIAETNQGHNVVLIIDEAQNLSVSQLEQIRLLSNLETEKEKLFQIILVGQPELTDKLKLTSLRQLNQRIAVRYHILPLGRDELAQYINHRLAVAFAGITPNRPVLFNNRALDSIYYNSKGTPRMINILCDRALLAGFTFGVYTIDESIVDKCVEEVSGV